MNVEEWRARGAYHTLHGHTLFAVDTDPDQPDGDDKPTLVLLHATLCINSLAHRWGRRTFETKDDSRNSLLLALFTLGEGWHNNHHHYCGSARQGFRWWEVDLSYYILRFMAALRLVWRLNPVPEKIVRQTMKP